MRRRCTHALVDAVHHVDCSRGVTDTTDNQRSVLGNEICEQLLSFAQSDMRCEPITPVRSWDRRDSQSSSTQFSPGRRTLPLVTRSAHSSKWCLNPWHALEFSHAVDRRQ